MGNDPGAEPTGESFRPPIAASRFSENGSEFENVKSVLQQGARGFDRQAIAPPIVRSKFDPKLGHPVFIFRIAKTGTSA